MRSGQPVGRTVPAIQVGGGAVDGADLVERELRVREDDVSRVSTTSFCGLQRIEESLVRPGVRHYAPNVGQRLCGRHTRASSAVERSDRRCAALGLHAVQQHGALFAAQLLGQRHGVLQDEAEVGVLRGVRVVDQADLDVLDVRRHVGGPDPAQRHRRVDAGRQPAERRNAAEPQPAVVRVSRQGTRLRFSPVSPSSPTPTPPGTLCATFSGPTVRSSDRTATRGRARAGSAESNFTGGQ